MFVSFRRGAPLLGALVFAGAGCVDVARHDAALAQLEQARAADARAHEARLAALEARQGMGMQQVGLLSGLVGTVSRDTALRTDELSRQNEQLAARLAQVEKSGAELARAQAEAQSPQAIVRKVQALIDAGLVKVVVKNGRARLEGPAGGAAVPRSTSAEVVPELENPWARPTKPPLPKKTDDLGF